MNRATLLAAASALVLSAGAAAAAPAVTESAVNMRSGPGTQFPVVTTLPGGAAVDVAGCTGSWCRVTWNGRGGYVSAGYLDMAGEPGPVVTGPPAYYDDEPDYGFYGPSFGYYDYYSGPSWRYRRNPGNWHGPRPGRPPFAGPRPGRPPVIGQPGPRPGFGNPGFQGGPRVTAPSGMPRGPVGFGPSPGVGARAPSFSAPSAGPAVGFPQGR